MTAQPKIKATIATAREKKAARRAKQRAANVGRAHKMHKARLADKDIKPDFSKIPKLNVGCSGWFYWDWRGIFYPQDLPKRQWFSYYAQHFDTVELNAPFYSWPTVATVKNWQQQSSGKDFVYTVKACELITHIRQFQSCKTLIQDFGYIADLLGPQMGCFLFQLPPSFKYSAARLKNILGQLDPARRNVVEFRHKSWWIAEVYKAFKKTNTIFCACSAPNLPDELIKTADDIYLRFHGKQKWYRYDYSDEELKIWAQRIKQANPRHVWIYFNNDYDGFAIKNAEHLVRFLKSEGSP